MSLGSTLEKSPPPQDLYRYPAQHTMRIRRRGRIQPCPLYVYHVSGTEQFVFVLLKLRDVT